jgi:hypothetical protein
MSNFALGSLILLVFIFDSGLALGSLARMRFNQQKRIRTGPKRPEPKRSTESRIQMKAPAGKKAGPPRKAAGKPAGGA